MATEPATGPLEVLGGNSRYFTDGSGKAIYLTGMHNWYSFKDMQYVNVPPLAPADCAAAYDYQTLLDAMVEYNHNFMRLWTWDALWCRFAPDSVMFTDPNNANSKRATPWPWLRDGGGTALDGQPRFNLDHWNEAYFDRLASRVEQARQKGIYVSVMLFEGYASQHVVGNGWEGPALAPSFTPFRGANNCNGLNADISTYGPPATSYSDGFDMEIHTLAIPAITAKQLEYMKRVVTAVQQYDNVLYEICNEANANSYEWQQYMVAQIRAWETENNYKRHPIGITRMLFGGNNETLLASNADWISPYAGTNDEYKTNPPATSGTKVVLADTDHIWGIGGDSVWVWKAFTRGMNVLSMEVFPLGTVDKPGINLAASQDRCKAMGQTLALARRIDLAHMTPQNTLASTTYCLAEAGNEYVVYSQSTSLTVTLPAGQEYEVEWINPLTGATAAGNNVVGTGAASAFVWSYSPVVLHLKRVDGPWGPDLVANGSFELDWASWTHAGTVEISSGLLHTDGVKGVAFSAGQGPNDGAVSQTIATTSGRRYELRFDAGAYYGTTSTQQRLRVTVNGVMLGYATVYGTGSSTPRYVSQCFEFTATGPATTVLLQDASTVTWSIDLLLDNVRVRALGTPPEGGDISGWMVAGSHGAAGEQDVEAGEGYVESRAGGIAKVKVAFSGALDAATVGASSVAIVGQVNGDQSGRISGVSLESDNTVMVVELASALPDADNYTLTVSSNVLFADGGTINNSRVRHVAALAGDVDGSGGVTAADVVAVREQVGEAVTAANARCDVDGSGAITGQDALAVRRNMGHSLP